MYLLSLIKSAKPALLLFAIAIIMQSCIPHKELVTLNGNETLPPNFKSERLMHTTQTQHFKVYQIQPYDQLMIKLNAYEGSTEEFLNREFSTQTQSGQNMEFDPASLYFNTYTVDKEGYLHLPIIEKMKVADLTTAQIKEKLDAAYKPYITYASTNVKMANNRITIMGEVNNPGVHYLYNDQNSILDAIGMAGDFTDFANRKKVKLLRQSDEGLQTIYLNMNRSEFMYSPFFWIQPYDVIYVEPTKRKSRDVGANTTGIVLSGISVGVLILNLFVK